MYTLLRQNIANTVLLYSSKTSNFEITTVAVPHSKKSDGTSITSGLRNFQKALLVLASTGTTLCKIAIGSTGIAKQYQAIHTNDWSVCILHIPKEGATLRAAQILQPFWNSN